MTVSGDGEELTVAARFAYYGYCTWSCVDKSYYKYQFTDELYSLTAKGAFVTLDLLSTQAKV